jgi:esterase/PHB depolymerase
MLADLENELPVDAHRIYASGFSNGAGFAARLAVDRSETFAAVGFSGGGLQEVHAPARSVPTYSTVGTLDDRVLAQLDPPLAELPLDPVSILTNARLDGYLSTALQTLGLDESLYGVLAQPYSTNFRWPATGTGPVSASGCSRASRISTPTAPTTRTASPPRRSSRRSSPSTGCPDEGGRMGRRAGQARRPCNSLGRRASGRRERDYPGACS